MDFDITAKTLELSHWEYAGYVAIAVVALGCIGESICEFTDWIASETLKKKIGKISAFILIFGLAGEGITQVHTNDASGQIIAYLNVEAASANERATKAASALEKFRAHRNFTQQQTLVEKLTPLDKPTFALSVFNDPEPIALMYQLKKALELSGWRQVPFPNTGGIAFGTPGQPVIGVCSAEGIRLIIPSSKVAIWDKPLSVFVDAINAEFDAAKIEHDNSGSFDSVEIFIGKKP